MSLIKAKQASAAKLRSKAVRHSHHPAAPLVEVQIFQTASHTLVGFPDAAPLKRATSNDLDNARRAIIHDLLAASPGATTALKNYAIDHGHLEAGPAKADLVAVLVEMWKSGLVIARGPAFKGVTASTLTLSAAGKQFLIGQEAQVGVSNKLHHPSAHSGVTLGPGYDMRVRTGPSIVSDLMSIGIDRAIANTVSLASQLTTIKADQFVDDHTDLITLTDNQQRALFDKVLPPYLSVTKKGLLPGIMQRLFEHEFDALVSYTYNLGHLKGTRLAYGINSGKLDHLDFFRHGPGPSRIRKEKRLFVDGIYL